MKFTSFFSDPILKHLNIDILLSDYFSKNLRNN